MTARSNATVILQSTLSSFVFQKTSLINAHVTESLPHVELESIGPYRIIRKLGAGGMGAVFLAEHQTLGSRCAVKVLLSHLTADAESVGRFQREMKAIGALSHPNIVRVLHAGEENGVHFIAMEYLDATDPTDQGDKQSQADSHANQDGPKDVEPNNDQENQAKDKPRIPEKRNGWLTPLSLVSNPSKIPGLKSWTLESKEPRGGINCIKMRPDGLFLAVAGNGDGTIRIYRSGKLAFVNALVGHSRTVRQMDWSKDGSTLVSIDDGGDVVFGMCIILELMQR
jgi:hypothetical protein